MEELLKIINKFDIKAPIQEISTFSSGHINSTYKVITKGSGVDYTLQCINHNVFKDVEGLQQNIRKVTEHIRAKLIARGESDIDRKVMTMVPTLDGKLYFFDGEKYWRMFLLISDSVSYDESVTPEYAYNAGVAFGDFQQMLSDLPSSELCESIPNFHNMEFRLQQFRDAVAQDSVGRVAKVRDLIDRLEKRAYEMCAPERMYRSGELVKRINHCDTKVNNVLFDRQGNILCVIDLDTVMPGFVLSDFGDFIRTGANTGAEDDPNLENIDVNMDIFRSYAKGYLSKMGGSLTDTEIKMLPFGAQLITYMQTVRFLCDYINGDTYYKIHHPEHNLQRTVAQLQLLEQIDAHIDEMNNFIREQVGA